MSADSAAGSGEAAHIATALGAARRIGSPYPHWLFEGMLPAATAQAICQLPFAPPAIDDTGGRRETHNSSRCFFAGRNRALYSVVDAVAQAFQGPPVVAAVEDLCAIELGGSFLRIEHCLDTDGFWLEPHTDIGAKLFTLLIYLSVGRGAETLGTDIMDPAGNVLAAAPAPFNAGLAFVPGDDTWHGFRRRAITGVRRSLIVNYVKPEWRSRHELAFPETPIAAA